MVLIIHFILLYLYINIHHSFKIIMEKKLLRSRNAMFAGVCGGIANYFSLDPTLVRVGYVILSVISAGFPGLLIYLLLMLIMPKE